MGPGLFPKPGLFREAGLFDGIECTSKRYTTARVMLAARDF